MKRKTEWIVVGDYYIIDGYEESLVCCAGSTEEEAKQTLERMLTNPTKNDIHLIGRGRNLRIKEVFSDECWWN